jgi:hypothetical protein
MLLILFLLFKYFLSYLFKIFRGNLAKKFPFEEPVTPHWPKKSLRRTTGVYIYVSFTCCASLHLNLSTSQSSLDALRRAHTYKIDERGSRILDTVWRKPFFWSAALCTQANIPTETIGNTVYVRGCLLLAWNLLGSHPETKLERQVKVLIKNLAVFFLCPSKQFLPI